MANKDILIDTIDILIESIEDKKMKRILNALNKSIKRDNCYIAEIFKKLKSLEINS